MESLFQRQERLLLFTKTDIVRKAIDKINWNARLISIRGSRGVGKTTLMLQYIKLHYPAGSREALYCSLDNLYFSNHTLLELAEMFYLRGGRHLFFDEIHKYDSWSREIKEIYDMYPDLKVVISGSSMLNIINADADLSRRCLPYKLPGLSFREFLLFYKSIELPSFTLDEILHSPGTVCALVNEKCRPIMMFEEYLRFGYYPFYDGNMEDYYMRIENVINFIIEQEMPALCNIDSSYSRKLKALLLVLAGSVPYEVDIAKLATSLQLARNTVVGYLQSLDKAELIKMIYADNISVKKMQKPDKIYIHNPNMLYAIERERVKTGTVREIFAVNQLSVNNTVEYGKDKGDFKVNGKIIFEVGGADKTFAQIADEPDSYILADNIEFSSGNKLPLWIVGMTY